MKFIIVSILAVASTLAFAQDQEAKQRAAADAVVQKILNSPVPLTRKQQDKMIAEAVGLKRMPTDAEIARAIERRRLIDKLDADIKQAERAKSSAPAASPCAFGPNECSRFEAMRVLNGTPAPALVPAITQLPVSTEYVMGNKPSAFVTSAMPQTQYEWCETTILPGAGIVKCYPLSMRHEKPLPDSAPMGLSVMGTGVSIQCFKRTARVTDPTPEKFPSLLPGNYLVKQEWVRSEDVGCNEYREAVGREEIADQYERKLALQALGLGRINVDEQIGVLEAMNRHAPAMKETMCGLIDDVVIYSERRLIELCGMPK